MYITITYKWVWRNDVNWSSVKILIKQDQYYVSNNVILGAQFRCYINSGHVQCCTLWAWVGQALLLTLQNTSIKNNYKKLKGK